ncbi:hypothetical protein [Streptomyces sp. NBC_01716]|uniref:hypothetical protein n=1 Tax=Streptomyces sp. NBC_01716 TaxID=2975917 RepID=UPI002E3617E2|nr:hypothetical protein [Streptomyces sp. NBC_01716]
MLHQPMPGAGDQGSTDGGLFEALDLEHPAAFLIVGCPMTMFPRDGETGMR